GAGGEDGHTRAPRQLGRALGRPRRRLFVADVDNAPARLHGPVVDREDVPAREGEDLTDLIAAEGRHRQLATVALHQAATSCRNPVRTVHHASGLSTWGEWPASAMTARRAPGMALAMRSDQPTKGLSCSPTTTSTGTLSDPSCSRRSSWPNLVAVMAS